MKDCPQWDLVPLLDGDAVLVFDDPLPPAAMPEPLDPTENRTWADCQQCGWRLDAFEHIQKCYMGRFQSGDIIETLTNSKVMVCACGHTASQHLRGNCDICSCLFYESSNPAVVKCFKCRLPVDSISHYQMCIAPQNPAATGETNKCPDCGSERKTYQHCLCRFLASPTVPAVGVDMASGKDRAAVGPAPVEPCPHCSNYLGTMAYLDEDGRGHVLNCPHYNPAATPQQTPKGTGREILPLVIEDLKARIEYGTKKYGEPLKAFNARDALMDAYQEGLDLVVYLKQAIEERNKPEMARGRAVLDGCVVCGNIYTEEGGGCRSCEMVP